MPFIMQYLQSREQQDTPLDLSGVAPSQPVGFAGGVASEYDTPFVRNLLRQMGGQPQGVDPQAMIQSLSTQPQQPELAKPLTGEAGVLQYLRENDLEAYEGYIRKKIFIAPPKTATGKTPTTPEEEGRALTKTRLGQKATFKNIDLSTDPPTITESNRPFGIQEAVAAGDSLANFRKFGTFEKPSGQQQQGQAFGGASSYGEVIQWYNSPAGQQHPQRDAILQEAKRRFGVQ